MGEDMMRTLIELYASQEQIKVTYAIRRREKDGNNAIPTSGGCAQGNGR